MHIFQRLLSIRVLLPCLLALLAMPSAAHAGVPKGDAFLGYSRLGNDAFYPNVGGLNGWEGALHFKVKPFIGLEGDFAQYGLGAGSAIPRTTMFLFGPRLTVGAAGFRAFAHALVGGEHSSNSSGLAISGGALTYGVGGGVEVPIAPFFGWRIAGDYINAPTQSPGTGFNGRIATGLVFRF